MPVDASVVVVTRNRAGSLARALQALRANDHPSYEIIVVDNGSTDDTAAVAAAAGARYTYTPSTYGVGRSRQSGVRAARGEIVAFCDDDCIPAADWLRHLVHRLRSEPDLGLVGGYVENIGFADNKRFKGRSRLGPNGTLELVENYDEAEFFGNANLALKRSALEAAGGYDPFFNVMAEIDVAMSLRRHGFRVAYEPAARVEHHHVGSSVKNRHFFYGAQLIRLYFFFKHFRPRSAGEWWRFTALEAQFTVREFLRTVRAAISAVIRWDGQHLKRTGIELFNLLSARLVIPWLLWRTRAVGKTPSSVHVGPSSSP